MSRSCCSMCGSGELKRIFVFPLRLRVGGVGIHQLGHHGFEFAAGNGEGYVVVGGLASALVKVVTRAMEDVRTGAAAAAHQVGDATVHEALVVVDVAGDRDDPSAHIWLHRFEAS